MCERLSMIRAELPADALDRFLKQVRTSHSNGGAHVAAFAVGPDAIFDWFASRNRLCDDDLINHLIVHPAVREALPDIEIPVSNAKTGLESGDPFLLDGRLARILYSGGAYTTEAGDGRDAKVLAIDLCDAMFGLRFGEVSLLESFDAWTPWFKGIASDITAVLFDRRLRQLTIIAITDTD
jgi:hypothetical protein